MGLTAREVSTIIVFAALYSILVVALAPISFFIGQVRIADALLPLSMIFGLPCAAGLALGCLIGNIYGWLVLGGALGVIIVDALGGSLANLAACMAAYYIGGKGGIFRRFLGTVSETAVIAVTVGGYLSIIFGVPLEVSLLGVLAGSVIAINLAGFIVEETVRRALPRLTEG